MRITSPKSKVQSPKSGKVSSVECRVSSGALGSSLVTRHSSLVTRSRAFTLLEVMIASGIFFIAMFAILGLLAQTLRNARVLRVTRVDSGMIAAQLTLTNKLYEGSESGDFGNYSSGYSWASTDEELMSNGLHQVQFEAVHSGEQ